MTKAKASNLPLALSYIVGAILVLLPFHALFTTWLASSTHHYDLIRIWKELLLVPVGILALWMGFKNKLTRKWLATSKLFYAIIAYTAVLILVGVFSVLHHNVNASALLYGLISDVRFLVIFVICLLLAAQTPWLKDHWQPLLLWPAIIVICFGLLQLLVLPADFLRHFGYSQATISPFQTVDLKQQYVRLQSTLRGPNPLGAYLVLAISAASALMFKDKRGRRYWAFLLFITSIVLYFTYSRSAIIGTLIAVGIIILQQIKNPKTRRWLLVCVGVFLALSATFVLVFRHNDYLQNTLFHTDEHSRSSLSSNAQRTSHLEQAVKDILHEPLGRGPGTAGPASVRNNHAPRIAENYYLQIGQEAGIAGLVIFVVINVMVAIDLFRIRRNNMLALVLFASFVGITFINMVSHAWGDDTLALLWWGFAGLAIGSNLLANKRR